MDELRFITLNRKISSGLEQTNGFLPRHKKSTRVELFALAEGSRSIEEKKQEGDLAEGSIPNSQPGSSDEEAILLDVQEMMCGACAASVKTILKRHPKVRNATVNLLTETAAVSVSVADKGSEELEMLEVELAALVTSSGFPTSVRKPEETDFNGNC